jgi:hypothetical protein
MKFIQPAIEIINVLLLEQIRLWAGFSPPLNRIKTALFSVDFGFPKPSALSRPAKILLAPTIKTRLNLISLFAHIYRTTLALKIIVQS